MKMTPSEYQECSRRSAEEQVEKRRMAWKSSECQSLYSVLLNAAGEPVRPGMRGQAKELAITAFLRGEQPDFEKFAERVKAANARQPGRIPAKTTAGGFHHGK